LVLSSTWNRYKIRGRFHIFIALAVDKEQCRTLYRGGCIGSWWGNQREGDHWGDLGVDGWIILGWISRRRDVGMWTGLGWPGIGIGGGRL